MLDSIEIYSNQVMEGILIIFFDPLALNHSDMNFDNDSDISNVISTAN